MPELPEVETCRRDLESFFSGSAIEEVRLFRKDLMVGNGRISHFTRGWTGTGIGRHGKILIMGLARQESNGTSSDRTGGSRLYLLSRFGMSGGWRRIEGHRNPLHTHFEIRFSGRSSRLVWVDPRRFGRLELTKDPALSRLLSRSGPDALELSLQTLEQALDTTSRSLRSALMDQHVLAGIGNIYMAEILFKAGLSPFRNSESLLPSERLRLFLAIQSVLRAAIAAGGSTIHSFARENGEAGGFQKQHLVYGREGCACVRCGLPIQRVFLTARSLYYCSSCQGFGGSTSRRNSLKDSLEI